MKQIFATPMRDINKYSSDRTVTQGLFNDKPAAYLTSGSMELGEYVEVFSRVSGRSQGYFKPTHLVTLEDAKGLVLIEN